MQRMIGCLYRRARTPAHGLATARASGDPVAEPVRDANEDDGMISIFAGSVRAVPATD